MVSTAAPKEYPDELRERAIRFVRDARRDPTTRVKAFKRIGAQLGINAEALRKGLDGRGDVSRTARRSPERVDLQATARARCHPPRQLRVPGRSSSRRDRVCTQEVAGVSRESRVR